MHVATVMGIDDLRLCEVEAPHAGPRDVVLKVHSVGICGTDLGIMALGGYGRPFALGHELAGTIVETGAEVKDFAVGDRVALNPLFNMIGNGGPEGGFAERLLVRDVVTAPGSLIRLPEGMSMEVGALLEPLAVAIHAADRLGASAGAKVALFGAGPIGLALIAVLRHRGIDDIVVFELSASRRARAERLGARAVIDPNQRDFREALIELHGSTTFARNEKPLTSHYLEVTGAPLVGGIIAAAAPRATICIVAMHKKPSPVDFGDVMAKELSIVGTMGYPTGFDEALAVMVSGSVDVDALVSHRFDGADILDAFATAKQADKSAKVLVQYGD